MTRIEWGDLGLYSMAVIFGTLTVAYALARRFYKTEAGWNLFLTTAYLAVLSLSLTSRKLPFVSNEVYLWFRPFVFWLGVVIGVWRWTLFARGFLARRKEKKENAK